MSLLERIQQLLKAKGVSIKKAEREAGIANATIRKWDQQKPSLESLIKIADYLQVSIDYLVRGDSQIPTSAWMCDGVPLDVAEVDMIAMFRLLDDQGQETAFDFVEMLYEKKTGIKGSVYSTYTDEEKGLKKSGPAIGEDSTAELA